MLLEKTVTETRNKNSMHIDQLDGKGIAKLINEEDHKVAEAVATQTDKIGEAIENIAKRFDQGGRIIYIGAGTSGRLGALDAIELTPTYSVPPERAFGILAGGQRAMFEAVEGAEDSTELAINDLKNIKLSERDTVIAIAASGRTPYAISSINYANQIGALSISVTCNDDNEMKDIAQIAISPVVGPEVITGSTRMKSGTAQKMVLNMISTGVMIKMGYVYENLMINVQPTNEKLINRAEKILTQILKIEREYASTLLKEAKNNVAAAIIMSKKSVSYESAIKILGDNNGQVRNII
ncbi:N-acetylmuramic acid 6-phosphate etherase [Pediococcus acidilactici]|uniref:N-acetylmuramic acid 6-phosphate etherase n=1 Tax=Pediococcus acidilactici TaxID=1254 RepID=UPI00132FD5A8|nr:N-acetylmuramic acid 6-phosphate etherase [Pediococcus acidilactici]KAF0490573.1 N-acetylmuramic acid 6-phosphate etherase [Pediococcus acidilactici]